MKTLLVGDLHLMAGIILPEVNKVVKKYDIKRVVLTGDYTDQWGCVDNSLLYKKDLLYLWNWKRQMTDNGVEVIMLVGNHDAPYLIGEVVRYSARNPQIFEWVRDILFDFNLQIAYQLDDYLISHAGYTEDYKLEDWHLRPITLKNQAELSWMHQHVGIARGGVYASGSPIWCDYFRELLKIPSLKYPKQIVGHNPVPYIFTEENEDIVGIDTFSVLPNRKAQGNGSLLIYNNGKMDVYDGFNWNSIEMESKRMIYLD